MSDDPKDEFPVDHRPLLEPSENFRALIDIDKKQFGAVFTALNARSMVAVLQFAMMVNPKRITGYVIRRESAIIGAIGELIAVVPAGSYGDQIVKHTRLKDPAPKEVPTIELEHWSTFKLKPKEKNMSEAVKRFIVEIVIDGVAEKFPAEGANEDSLIALFTASMCAQMPRISGFNLYRDDGQMVVSVPGMKFFSQLAEISPLGKPPADPKTAGWRALPAIAPTSEEFQKSIEAAKKAGKTST